MLVGGCGGESTDLSHMMAQALRDAHPTGPSRERWNTIQAAKKYLADSNYIPGTELSSICASASGSIAKVIQGIAEHRESMCRSTPIRRGFLFCQKLASRQSCDLSLNTYLPSLFDAATFPGTEQRPHISDQLNPGPKKSWRIWRMQPTSK